MDTNDVELTLVQIMAWCPGNKPLPEPMLPYGDASPHSELTLHDEK